MSDLSIQSMWNLIMRKHSLLLLVLFGVTAGYKYESKNQDYYQNNQKDVDIQISFLDSPLLQIHWCGLGDNNKRNDAVLVLTSKGTVYRSDDNGRQWSKLSEAFQRKALIELESSDQRVGIVNNILPSLNDTSLVLFAGTEYVSWISLDCGRTISVIASGRQLRDFQWHPTQPEWILASAWKRCPAEDLQCKSFKELLLSQDYGSTWNQLATYVSQYSWGCKTVSMTKNVPEERILVAFDPVGKGHQTMATWSTQSNLYYSDDFFKTRILSVPNGARFLLSESYLFVAQVTNAKSQEVSLWVTPSSSPLGFDFEIIDADANLLEHGYQILDTAENQVFMIVNHLKPSSPMGVIYISDSTGTRYSRSLENAVRLEQGGSEFYRVLGLEGIYLANVYSDEQAKIYEKQVMEQQANGLVINDNQGFKDEDLAKFKQTRITFDKGGRWVPLKPPSVDSEGKPIKCDPKVCSLHLNVNQAYHQFGPVYSQQNAIGIIVATGSIGKYLSQRPDQINTYLSRDGGLTWHEIHKGSHIYELSDHGGLMVMTSDQKGQTTVKYSWNEGLSWNVLPISDDNIEVHNIITEPSNSDTRFIVYGVSTQEVNGVNQEQGIIVTIDLDELHQRKCVYSEEFDPKSDYELWTPSGIVNPECLFGKKVTYVRRKREAQCYNPLKIEKINSVESCPCSNEDYECDLGFKFNSEQQQCLPINGTLSTEAPAECKDTYEISSGYRKVAGNICQGGVQKPPIIVSCPNKSSKDWLVVLILGAALYWAFQNQDKIRALIPSKEEGRLPVQHEKQSPSKPNPFSSVQLEENDRGLGYQEFDEDLLEKDEPLEVEIKQDSDLI